MAADWERAKREAAELIRKYKIAKPPVNPELIAKAEGVDVAYANFKPDIRNKISGFIRFDRQTGCAEIVVNKAISPNRIAFTIAHELAHYLLHRNGYAKDDKRYQVLLRNNVYSGDKPKEEQEADCFAANLLVPAFMLKEYNDEWTDNAELARIFGVSQEVIFNRMRFIGI